MFFTSLGHPYNQDIYSILKVVRIIGVLLYTAKHCLLQVASDAKQSSET